MAMAMDIDTDEDRLRRLKRQLGKVRWEALLNRDNIEQIKQLLDTLPGCLVFVGTTNISCYTKFVARDKLKKEDTVKFGSLYYGGHWFPTRWEEEKDQEVKESIVRYQTLKRHSSNSLIIGELGGEAKAETCSVTMMCLLQQQANGEEGPLLTNDTNVFYIRDVYEDLHAVLVTWSSNGWYIRVTSLTTRLDGNNVSSSQFEGNRIFSCNS